MSANMGHECDGTTRLMNGLLLEPVAEGPVCRWSCRLASMDSFLIILHPHVP